MKNIFFIGLRGSGKTTTGKALAKRFQLPFQDTDELIEKTHATTIKAIVHAHGWKGFRARESDVLRAVCARQGQVISTGGGSLLSLENRKRITGVVFYLQAPLNVLFARLSRAPNNPRRPPLYHNNLREELATAFKEREHLYLAQANHVLDATQPTNALLDEIDRLCPEIASFHNAPVFPEKQSCSIHLAPGKIRPNN